MDRRSSVLTGNGAEPSRRRRALRSARYARWSPVIEERRTMTASTSGGLSVRKATERRWTRLSLPSWCIEAQTETSAPD